MKKNYITIAFICAFFTACKNDVFNRADLSQFRRAYVVQAAQGPYASVLEITDSIQSISINCALGGDLSAKSAITLDISPFYDSVAAYNNVNGTDYLAVPQASFELSSKTVAIKKGEYLSSSVQVLFKTKGYIEPSTSYLLPIGISSTGKDIQVNNKLRVVYLLITGAYPIGKEPPKKVFNVGEGSLISIFPYKNSLVDVESNGLFHVFLWDNDSQTYSSSDLVPNGGWQIFDDVLASNDHLIARWAGTGTLWEYGLDLTKPGLSGDYVSHGEGFNDFDMISYSEKLDGLLCRKSSGELYLVKRGQSMWDNSTLLGNGMEGYRKVFAYQNGVLCIDTQGEMYFYNIKSDLSLEEKAHVGSGWDRYKFIVAKESQLLALDDKGILWQYNFDLAGFWDVR